MKGEFFIENYFRIGYLKYFLRNKLEEINRFTSRVKSQVEIGKYRGSSFVRGITELEKKLLDLPLFEDNKFNSIRNMIQVGGILEVYFNNIALLDQFVRESIKPSEKNIKEFLIANFNLSDCGALLSCHRLFRNSEYYREKIKEEWNLGLLREPKEFVLQNFNELFLNDEGYTLGIFVFLEGIVEKFGLPEKFGVFKEIHLKGKAILSKKYSEKELSEVVQYFKEKQKESEHFY